MTETAPAPVRKRNRQKGPYEARNERIPVPLLPKIRKIVAAYREKARAEWRAAGKNKNRAA